MLSKSDNIEIMIYVKADIFCRYEVRLETSMECSGFLFDCDNLLYCKCHKINLNCCRSYVNSLDSMKNIKD